MANRNNTRCDDIKQPSVRVNQEYFSGSQASLFIGDIWVDDIVDIQYSVEHSQRPIYGYGSQHFDFVSRGNILVSGSFSVNFREPNYLWLILSRYAKFDATRGVRGRGDKKDEKEYMTRDKALIQETYEGDRRKRFDQFFSTPTPTKVKEDLIEQSLEFNGTGENNSKENLNHKTFDILLGYGDTLNENAVGETIKSVHIVGKTKVISANGTPIKEQYNFIARKIV